MGKGRFLSEKISIARLIKSVKVAQKLTIDNKYDIIRDIEDS